MVHQHLLDEGKIEDLVAALGSINPPSSEVAEKIRIEAGYFENNANRMRYPEFRRQHLFVGSGVIEAGCKTIIGSRCKQVREFGKKHGGVLIRLIVSNGANVLGRQKDSQANVCCRATDSEESPKRV